MSFQNGWFSGAMLMYHRVYARIHVVNPIIDILYRIYDIPGRSWFVIGFTSKGWTSAGQPLFIVSVKDISFLKGWTMARPTLHAFCSGCNKGFSRELMQPESMRHGLTWLILMQEKVYRWRPRWASERDVFFATPFGGFQDRKPMSIHTHTDSALMTGGSILLWKWSAASFHPIYATPTQMGILGNDDD